ncbi:conserved hypothetical protein [Trichinella spiralis]|uniref:hypothetical protein n=1 Tax=Trichinella spiralis TaxID=6334 RepID=UPI0001EFB7DE|nr:conserved hypothetical protein [Trichinella spiralis]
MSVHAYVAESCKPTLQERMSNVDKFCKKYLYKLCKLELKCKPNVRRSSFSLLKSGPYNGTDVNSVSCSADCLRQAIVIKRTAKRGYTTEQSIKWTMLCISLLMPGCPQKTEFLHC